VKIVHIAPRLGDIRHSVAEVSKAKELLDFAPKVSLDQGMASMF
jgi:nucleoside-diphosphate-sugar epimerase